MPRPSTLPAASTASAKAARSNFYCELCQKGYSRMNDYESHLSSYDHTHKQRLKEMKEMQRSVVPKKEERGPLISVKLGGKKEAESGKGGGWKKVGGFKNAFTSADQQDTKEEKAEGRDEKMNAVEEADSDVTDEEDYYDPRKPTGCMPGCPGYDGAK